MRTLTSVIIILLLVSVGGLQAQQSQSIQSGQRVRITAPGCGMHQRVTAFEEFGGRKLLLTTATCPLDSVTMAEVSRGRKSRVLDGMAIGFVSGVVIGAGYGVTYCVVGGCNVAYTVLVGGFGMLFGAPPGLALGVLGGIVATLAVPGERWEEVPLDRLRVSVAPQRDGRFALGLTYRF